MKSENPGLSLGALQQKTMARMAELKAEREAALIKQQHERDERARKEEEERQKNKLANKVLGKWMAKANVKVQDDDGDDGEGSITEEHLDGGGPTSAASGGGGGASSNFNDSSDRYDRNSRFNESNNSRFFNNSSDNNNNILTHLIPTGALNGARNSIMMGRSSILMRRDSSSNHARSRRTSVDTAHTTQSSAMNSSITGEMMDPDQKAKIDAGLIGDDQADNFAPRRSVGDLSVHLGFGGQQDRSDRSAITEASGLIETDSIGRLSMSSRRNSSHINDDDDEDCISSLGDGLRGPEELENLQETEREIRARHLGADDDIGTSRERLSHSFTTTSSMGISSAARSLGGSSNVTTDFSIMSCGLIVGFVDRSDRDQDGLIVEFVDRSRIRDKREKEDRQRRKSKRSEVTDGGDDINASIKTHDTDNRIKAWRES